MLFEFDTIQEASDFADTFFNAKVSDKDDESIRVAIGMYYDRPDIKEEDPETETQEETKEE